MGAWDKGRTSHGNGIVHSGLYLCCNRGFRPDYGFGFIHLAGGTIVLFMGIGLLFRKGEAAKIPAVSGRARMFLSSFAIGITNPAAILTFLFAFSWFGIAEGSTPENGWLVVLGVFIGTYLWWGGLTTAVALARKKKRTDNLRKMNRIFGGVLSLFGIFVFIRAIPT